MKRWGFCASFLCLAVLPPWAGCARSPVLPVPPEIPPNVRLHARPDPCTRGLSYAIEAAGLRLGFWPQEGWSMSPDPFEFIRKDQIDGLTEDASGNIRYEIRRLRRPGVSMSVEIRPLHDGIEAVYRVRNGSGQDGYLGLAPCLQLPEGDFSGAYAWDRTKRVLVATEESGLCWLSDTLQARGTAPHPWAQILLASKGHDHAAFGPHDANLGLKLFGCSDEHAAAGFICARDLAGRRLVAAACDPGAEVNVSFALLNCLHVNLGKFTAAGGEAVFRYRVYFHDGTLESLLARIRRDFPGIRIPDPDESERLIPPETREKILDSFENGVPAEWEAGEGILEIARPKDPFLTPTEGLACLRVDLRPGTVLRRGPFRTGMGPSWLSLDVGAPAGEGRPTKIEVSIEGVKKLCCRTVEIPRGKYRRIVLPLRMPSVDFPLRLTLAPAPGEPPCLLYIDAFALHTPQAAEPRNIQETK